MTSHGTLRLQTVTGTGLRFEARLGRHAVLFDGGPEAESASPVMHLLGSIAACGAMDVISILRKKRLEVSGYVVEVTGERAEQHPKRFTSVTIVHRVTGRGVPLEALEDAVRLSATRYCSVRATLDPAMPVTDRCEVVEG